MRQIVLDTETTGFDAKNGDKIIEIGAIEVIKRKITGSHYHQYIQPERDVPQDAIDVHGITNDFLEGKPIFSEVVEDFMAFVTGSELIIHNAPFDVGFINHELSLLKNNAWGRIEDHCKITDSLKMAKKSYPGQRNSLDALCKRLGVDNSNRALHGALLDSEILADVYLAMTGGQTDLLLTAGASSENERQISSNQIDRRQLDLRIIPASSIELAAHQSKLAEMTQKTGKQLNW